MCDLACRSARSHTRLVLPVSEGHAITINRALNAFNIAFVAAPNAQQEQQQQQGLPSTSNL